MIRGGQAISSTARTRSLALIVVLWFSQTAADLPLHCELPDVVGEWKFILSNLSNGTEQTHPLVVNLIPPATASTGNSNGSFTMTYDEGMEIRVSGLNIFVFFEYKTWTPSSQDLKSISSHSRPLHLSFCHATSQGWFSVTTSAERGLTKDHGRVMGFKQLAEPMELETPTYYSLKGEQEWKRIGGSGLHFAPKDQHSPSLSKFSLIQEPLDQGIQSRLQAHSSSFFASQNGGGTIRSPFGDWFPSEPQDILKRDPMFEKAIQRIKSMHQSLQGETPELALVRESKSIETMSMSSHGVSVMSAAQYINLHTEGEWQATEEESQQGLRSVSFPKARGLFYIQVPSTTVGRSANYGYAKSFDWRPYMFPVYEQGNCGSCFAFATVDMIQTRIAIKSKNAVRVPLSVQNLVSCSPYAQGCNGGLPYLAAKTAMDFGLTREECWPYGSHPVQCSQRMEAEGCEDRTFIADYYYVGGYYGAGNEEAMLKEIWENGPVSVALEVHYDMVHYRKGVYRPVNPPEKSRKAEEWLGKWRSWVPTNHALLCIGWGETAGGSKFWILKNSWGSSWGEDGYIRILRGADVLGVESMAVAARV